MTLDRWEDKIHSVRRSNPAERPTPQDLLKALTNLRSMGSVADQAVYTVVQGRAGQVLLKLWRPIPVKLVQLNTSLRPGEPPVLQETRLAPAYKVQPVFIFQFFTV